MEKTQEETLWFLPTMVQIFLFVGLFVMSMLSADYMANKNILNRNLVNGNYNIQVNEKYKYNILENNEKHIKYRLEYEITPKFKLKNEYTLPKGN